MKMPSDNDELLHAVLDSDDELRAKTLQAGLTALRRRRANRSVARAAMFVLAPMLAIVALSLAFNRSRSDSATRSHSSSLVATRTIEGTAIRDLTDEELLAFFKGRPVALVGSPGHQQLVLFDQSQALTEW
jgi:hypothetical protein